MNEICCKTNFTHDDSGRKIKYFDIFLSASIEKEKKKNENKKAMKLLISILATSSDGYQRRNSGNDENY